MSEMVEKVAEALANSVGWDPSDGLGNWIMPARAAIAAMREPTNEMRYAGFATWGCDDDPASVATSWRAMIDAALEPVDDDVDKRVSEKAKLLK